MNVKLLRKVQKFLLAEPRRFDMTEGIKPAADISSVLKAPPCGTVCCIAGAAYIIENKIEGILKGTNKFWSNVEESAISALDLNEMQSNRLFMIEGLHSIDGPYWPDKFAKAYKKAKTPLQRAKAGVARIEHFIKTEGAE